MGLQSQTRVDSKMVSLFILRANANTKKIRSTLYYSSNFLEEPKKV